MCCTAAATDRWSWWRSLREMPRPNLGKGTGHALHDTFGGWMFFCTPGKLSTQPVFIKKPIQGGQRNERAWCLRELPGNSTV